MKRETLLKMNERNAIVNREQVRLPSKSAFKILLELSDLIYVNFYALSSVIVLIDCRYRRINDTGVENRSSEFSIFGCGDSSVRARRMM